MTAARPAGRSVRTGGAPQRDDLLLPLAKRRDRLPEDTVAERPHDPSAVPPGDQPPRTDGAGVDFAQLNGWDRDWEIFSDYDLPTYVGPTTFMNLPWITDPAELRDRAVDVAVIGAPF